MTLIGLGRVDPTSPLVCTCRWDSRPAASEPESTVTVNFDDLGDGYTEMTVTDDSFPAWSATRTTPLRYWEPWWWEETPVRSWAPVRATAVWPPRE
jgi:hypothetical protein